MRRLSSGPKAEPTIALINIVFLMLIFFLVAGTLARPLDKDLSLINTSQLDGTPPPDALVIHADGQLRWRGETLASEAEFIARLPEERRERVRIIPDRDLAAVDLVRIGRALRQAGARKVVMVTERGLK